MNKSVRKNTFFISLVLVISLVLLAGCNQQASKDEGKEVPYEVPIIEKDINLGADIPTIVYDSKDEVIFLNYMGIFIYDLNTTKMINAFKPIDPNYVIYTQGDRITMADFDIKENIITFYQMDEKGLDYFYKFDRETDKLYKYPIDKLVKAQDRHEIVGKMDSIDWTTWNLTYKSELTEKTHYPFRDIIK